MNRTHISTLAAAIATVWLAAPTAAMAGEQEGVHCPAGATAQISNGNKTLRCTKVENVDRPAVCSPVVFQGNGDVLLNTRIGRITSGYLPRLNRSRKTSSAMDQMKETIRLWVAWSILVLFVSPANVGRWLRRALRSRKDRARLGAGGCGLRR